MCWSVTKGHMWSPKAHDRVTVSVGRASRCILERIRTCRMEADGGRAETSHAPAFLWYCRHTVDSNLRAMASDPKAMASDLLAMASNLLATASMPIAMALAFKLAMALHDACFSCICFFPCLLPTARTFRLHLVYPNGRTSDITCPRFGHCSRQP